MVLIQIYFDFEMVLCSCMIRHTTIDVAGCVSLELFYAQGKVGKRIPDVEVNASNVTVIKR